MKCLNCKFWDQNDKQPTLGICDKVEMCDSNYMNKKAPFDACIEADASDDSGLSAQLVTTTDFLLRIFYKKIII